MQIESPLSREVLAEFQKLGYGSHLQVTSERYSPREFGGSTRLVFLLEDLEIRCIGRVGELTVEVKPTSATQWNSTAYLYAFFERVNTVEDVLNSKMLVEWLAKNFRKVRDLLCDPAMLEQRSSYEAFASNLHKVRQEMIQKHFRTQP
jgi:hypothetical protein